MTHSKLIVLSNFDNINHLILNINIMKKITLLAAFLVAGFSYGQTTSSGFVLNPSFEDGLSW